MKSNGLNSAQNDLNNLFTENVFMIFFVLAEHLSRFRDVFNTCCPNMSFFFEQNGKLSFLDIEVSRKKKNFVTTIYRKYYEKYTSTCIQLNSIFYWG